MSAAALAGGALAADALDGCKGHEAKPSGAAPPPSTAAPAAPGGQPKGRRGGDAQRAARLNAAEERALAATLERLLPGDAVPGLPGARAAGVGDYVQRELAKPQFAGIARELRRGLQRLDLLSRREGGGEPFAARDAVAQDDLLRRFQTGRIQAGRLDTRRWFELLLTLALEGYLGDPAYGGNRDGSVWAALGMGGQCGGTPGFTGGAAGPHSLGGHGPGDGHSHGGTP